MKTLFAVVLSVGAAVALGAADPTWEIKVEDYQFEAVETVTGSWPYLPWQTPTCKSEPAEKIAQYFCENEFAGEPIPESLSKTQKYLETQTLYQGRASVYQLHCEMHYSFSCRATASHEKMLYSRYLDPRFGHVNVKEIPPTDSQNRMPPRFHHEQEFDAFTDASFEKAKIYDRIEQKVGKLEALHFIYLWKHQNLRPTDTSIVKFVKSFDDQLMTLPLVINRLAISEHEQGLWMKRLCEPEEIRSFFNIFAKGRPFPEDELEKSLKSYGLTLDDVK